MAAGQCCHGHTTPTTTNPSVFSPSQPLLNAHTLRAGFSLFSGWIWYREDSAGVAAAWTAAVMTLGFAAGAAYVVVALRRSRGDARVLWLGATKAALAGDGPFLQ